MKLFKTLSVLGAVLVAGGLLSVSGAQARPVAVRQAVRAQERAIQPKLNRMLRVVNNPNAKPAKLERVLTAIQTKAMHAAQVVAGAYAANSKLAAGQRDWVAATRQLARGLGQLVAALRAGQSNQVNVAKRDARQAMRTINASETRGKKADRELGIH